MNDTTLRQSDGQHGASLVEITAACQKPINGMGGFAMRFFLATRLSLAALFLGAVSAGAATITVNDAPWTDPGLIRVDFSRFQVCGQTGDLETEGGRFRAVGLSGQKGTVCGDASRAQVRKGTPEYIELSGRHGAEYWLDSNDVPTIEFKLRSQKVQFLTSDLADVYGYFRLVAGNASYEINTKQKNGGLWLFTVVFDKGEERRISLNSIRNDGFSIGPVTVAPVPVPAAGLMLLGGLGALVAMRRARRGSLSMSRRW